MIRRAPVAIAVAQLAAVLAASACGAPPSRVPTPVSSEADLREYAGTWVAGPLAALQIEAVDGMLAVVPPFWGSRPYFRRAGDETFAMVLPHPEPGRTITFTRRDDGALVQLVLNGVDRGYDGEPFRRTSAGAAPTAYEMFFSGRPLEAARAALAAPSVSPDELRDFGLNALLKYPSRAADAAALLGALAAARPDDARLAALLGHALVAAGRRDDARAALQRARRLDPHDELAGEGLRRLDLVEPPAGRGYRAVLPFTLAEVFAPPTRVEIEAVERDWSGRDLAARGTTTVHTFELALSHATYDGRVVRHLVDGRVHYGAIFVPRGEGGPLPVVLDVRGVDVEYSPLDVSDGTRTMVALGTAQPGFVFVVPALRGNTLRVGAESFVAEGDPSDAWDGATDDTLALLGAVLATEPRADPDRVAVLGYSRGGTVALLAGERDPRISLVLAVAGPVDHLAAMDPVLGWSWAEVLADDMRDGQPPSLAERDESSQVFDHFLHRAVSGGEDVRAVRRRLIASSPLYFASRLPEIHAYYGAEDRSVPLANARLLERALAAAGRIGRDATVRVFPGRGHDTDPYVVQQVTRRELESWARELATGRPVEVGPAAAAQ